MKKDIVLFGAGRIGEFAYYCIFGDRVLCFADNYKQGTSFCGKKVISIEELKELSAGITVIITSGNYSGVIAKQLEDLGVADYQILENKCSEAIMQFKEPFYYNLLNVYNIEKYHNIAIMGINEFSPLLVSIFKEKNMIDNIKCFITETGNGAFCNIPCKKLMEIEKMDCILVDVERKNNPLWDDELDYNEKLEIIDFFDIGKLIPPPGFTAQLKKYKNIHKGRRCFIIGNGPSLNASDLDVLYENHEITFGVNMISKIFNQTSWRPTYYCVADLVGMEEFLKDFISYSKESIIFAIDYFNYRACEEIPVYNNINYLRYFATSAGSNGTKCPRFSSDIVQGVYPGFLVIYDLCLQIAAYMGFSEIYLLGVDNSFIGKYNHETAHFCPDYFDESHKKIIQHQKNAKNINDVEHFLKLNMSFRGAEIYSRHHGIRIYNATRGGILEEFERVDFDSIFNRKGI